MNSRQIEPDDVLTRFDLGPSRIALDQVMWFEMAVNYGLRMMVVVRVHMRWRKARS